MCKAHVLRFSCSHGLLMSLEPCPYGPCPVLKTTGVRLPQQPYRCYNCQRKRSATSTPSSSSLSSCGSSVGSLDSISSASSASTAASSILSTSPTSPTSPKAASCKMMSALPGVARQPSNSVAYTRKYSSPVAVEPPYTFACSSSNHYPVPHYATLPAFLPHKDHACPPCQLEAFRAQGDREVGAAARREYPHLKAEQLVRNGRAQDEWQGKLTCERYVEEKRQEERELWHFVTRKWTQDLKNCRVLIAEEDGLSLLQS